MGSKKTPDVEVLDPVLAVQEVQGGTLAERNSEQAVTVAMCHLGMIAKEGFQVSERNVAKSAQINSGDRLHGSFFAGHTGKYSGRFGLEPGSGHHEAADLRFGSLLPFEIP
jgi:hypothetical protein